MELDLYNRAKKRYLTLVIVYTFITIALLMGIVFLANSLKGGISENLFGKDMVIAWIVFVLFALPDVFYIYAFAKGKYGNGYNKYIKPLSQEQKQAINEEIKNSYNAQGFYMTEDYIFALKKVNFFVIPYSDIIWLYKLTMNYNYAGATAAKTASLIIIRRDKVKCGVNIDEKSKSSEEIIKRITEKRPNVIIGYDEERMQLYKEDFERMIEISDGIDK